MFNLFRNQKIYIASFPKSGNTWMRFILANYLAADGIEVNFQNLGEYVPDLHRKVDLGIVNDKKSLFNKQKIQFLKTHNNYSKQFEKSIYIVRDGRDQAVSFFYWLNERSESKIELNEIIKGYRQFGTWSDHVLSWLNHKNVIVVRYEDLLVFLMGIIIV